MPWQAVAVSAKGTKHERSKQPCQDYGDYEILSDGEVIIGVVSDGMGSASHSEVGSKLAVRVGLKELGTKDWRSRPEHNRDAEAIFNPIVREIRKAFERHAAVEGYSVQMLACTLLAFVATPEWLIAMQVGDGFIVAQTGNENLRLLFKPDKGEFANETTSVTSSKVFDEIKVSVSSNSYGFICVSTDGIENISLIKQEDWKPFDNFFIPLQRHMESDESLERKKEDLEKFLNSEKLNQKTDDDKTLLLCVYKNPKNLDDQKIYQEQNSQAISETPAEQLDADANTKNMDSVSSTVQPSDNSESSQIQDIQSTRKEISSGSNFEDISSFKNSSYSVQNDSSKGLKVNESSNNKLEDEKATDS
jgi:serine/threonine protein phosphatase PrpC